MSVPVKPAAETAVEVFLVMFGSNWKSRRKWQAQWEWTWSHFPGSIFGGLMADYHCKSGLSTVSFSAVFLTQ